MSVGGHDQGMLKMVVTVKSSDLKPDRLIVSAWYQAEFPRSKKKRIRRKWEKDVLRRWRPTPYGGAKRRDGKLVVSPAWIEARKRRVRDSIDDMLFEHEHFRMMGSCARCSGLGCPSCRGR